MDTSKMTREQKEELLRLLQQKALLEKEAILEKFKPNPGSQEAFFKSQARTRALIGGNGLGKTTCLVLELIYTHLKAHPFRDCSSTHHSWVIVPSFDKVEDYWREIKKWCPPSQLPTPDKMGTSNIRRLRWLNGDISTFYSFDQDPEKLEGTNFDKLFMDECAPRALYIAAYRGLRANENYSIVMALTPISEPWLYEEVYLKWAHKTDPEVECFVGSSYENIYLSRAFIEDFKSKLTDDEVRTRIYGEFAVLQGRVYKEFSRKTHVFKAQPIPEGYLVWCIIDPHPRKAHCALYATVTEDDIVVIINELKIDGTVDELAQAMRDLEVREGYKVVCRRIDNSGSMSDWQRDSVVTHLDRWSRENRYNVRVSPMRRAEKEIHSGIQKVKLRFKNNTLRIFDRCKFTITDLEMYSWFDGRSPESNGMQEKPRKIYDDFPDLIRYLVMSNPVHSPSLSYITLNDAPTAYNKDHGTKRVW